MTDGFSAELRGFFWKIPAVLIFFCLSHTTNAQTVDCSVAANCGDPYCQFASNIEQGCNCFDGIDNDGDGNIDKADSNCATYYGLMFVGEDSDCSIVPPGANSPFDLVDAPVTSAQNTADTQSKVSVGDVDGDGIPDAVITSKWNSEIRVVATADGQADGTGAGQIKSSFKTTGQGAKIFSGTGDCKPHNLLFEHENAIADIDGDGKSELFAVVSNRGGNPSTPPTCFFLVSFTYEQGTLVPLYNAIQIGTDRPGTFGVADMDGDGKAEIYLRDRIYAAETGALLATGNGDWDLDITSGPVAVNVTGDATMELVSGTKIFSIPDLSNRNPATPATLTLVADMNTIDPTVQAFVKLAIDPVEYGTDTHSMTSVADIDRDGNMDVVISGALNSVAGPTTVFYWNVTNGTVSHYVVTDPLYANGWPWGTGRVNLGDANGDGQMDLLFIAGAYLHALTTDASGSLVPLWPTPRQINDSRSGVLTVSIYDFNNDGDPEVVYRDSQELAVIDGATGQTKLWSAVCQSHTYTEGPVIADVNGDGSTDICVSCNTSNSFDINDPIQQQALGQFRLYYSSGNEWLPTRKVWNQPGYFVVNVNDDLTLPFPQFDQNIVFGEGDCLNGLPGPQMPLNMFLNQVPYLAANGCPVYPAPDLAFDGDNPDNPGVDSDGDGEYTPTVEVIPPICGDLGVSVRFNIINSGDLPITANIPVSFFVGDPTDPNITSDSLLHSTTLPIANLGVDSTYTSDFISFNATGNAFRLYIVLNNDGSILPIDPAGSVSNECRIDNNIYSAFIQPDPFETTIEKIADNFKCDDSAPDNGELRVRIFKAGVEVTDYSQYGFQWYAGTTASNTPISGATNYNITGLAEGDYTAVVTNLEKGCVGLPVDTVVVRQGNDPEVVVTVTSHQTVCNPPNGELQAQITGGNTGFTFEWFDIALNPLGISGPTANNLVAGNYIVRVSKDGCSKNSLPQTIDGPVVPDATAETLQNVVDCSDPNTGSITATALFNNVEQDPANYSFDWYFYDNATSTRGSILPGAHGTGPTRTLLPVGHYQVVVTDLATQCAAVQAPVTEITSQTVIPTAVITELAPQTSCDPASPNGRLQGAVDIGGAIQDPSGYTFEWFQGDNTMPENSHTNVSGVNGSVAEGVSGGGVFYTLRVTTSNNCSDTEKLIITEDLNVPVVTLTATDNGVCDPALATSNYNGTVTASVTFDGVAVSDFSNYEITWHDGSLDTDPVIAGETASLLDERNGGFYTVVVERTDLSCSSVPVTAEVLNATVLPTIETDSIPSTNCAGGAPNGGVAVTSVVPADTYSYRWFDPSNTLMAGETADAIAGYQGGAGENYTVEVTLASTGCRNTLATGIPDVSTLPSVTLAPTPNTICDPALTSAGTQYNGSIAATITNLGSNNLSDYEFTWYDADDGTQLFQDSGVAGSDLLNLDSGDYTLVVEHVILGCVSDPVSTQVLANTALPVITLDANASTNCAPALANGQAIVTDVDGAGVASPYVFQWHDGNTTASPLAGETSALLDNIQGGVGEFYTVLVTNQDDGCQNTQTVEVADERMLPLFTLAAQPNTICDASLTDPAIQYNGRIDATITNLGALGLPDYDFEWTDEEDGSVAFDALGGGTTLGESLINRDTSDYTLVVEQVSTGCVSNPVSAEITPDFDLPVITADANASTNCDPDLANGGVQVTDVDGLGTPGNFVFEWHRGSTIPGAVIADAAVSPDTLQGGVGRFYSVLVTNQEDGCQNTQTVEVADERVLPLFTLATQPNTICDASLTDPAIQYNGRIDATITNLGASGLPDYDFEWTDEEDGSIAFDALGGGTTLGESLINRDTSYYTLVVEQVSTGCVSNPVSAEITPDFNLPVITANANASTNCDPLLANGSVEVTDVDGLGTPANFDFEWHRGSTIPGTIIADVAVSPDTLQGGVGRFYTALVTNTDDGCQNTQTVEVPDERVLPLFTLAAQPNTICDAALASTAYNGRIDATITNLGALGLPDYDFEWTDEEDGSVAFDALGGGTTLGESLINRDTSYYTLVVEQVSTGCVSNPVSAEITPDFNLPVITANANASTNCDPLLANGSVEVTDVDGLGTPGNFDFEWHRGSIIPGTIIADVAVSPDTLQGGVGRFYTALVTNTDDGCQNTQTVEVPDERVLPLFTLAAQPNTICDATLASTAYNGRIDASITNPLGFPLTDFHFQWTDEEDGSPAFDALGGGTTLGEALINRDTSYYTLVVEQVSTGCVSNPVTAEITPDFDLPVITANANASTNCDPLLANGSVEVTDVDGLGTPANFDFEWHRGSIIPGTIIADVAVSPDTLQGGVGRFYTALVTNTDDGCQNTQTVEVPDERVLPLFTLAAQPNTICDSTLTKPVITYNGAVASTITNQGAFPIEDYHFTWIDEEDGATVFDKDGGGITFGETLVNRDSSIYSLTITQISTGCASASTSVQVPAEFFIPVIDIADTPQTSCDALNPNGVLASTIDETSDGGLGSVRDGYEFVWHNGNSTAGTIIGTTTATNGEVDQLAGNTFYTVQVTRESTGCRNTKSFFLTENIEIPVATLAATAQTECSPSNGEIVATVAPAPSQTYTYYWLKEDPFATTTDPATVISEVDSSPLSPNRKFTGAVNQDTDIHGNLIYGTYTLVVIDDYTTCISSTTTATVDDDTNSDIAFNPSNTPSACAVADGILDIQATRLDGTPTNFTFDIWLGGPTNATTPINFYTNPPTFDPALNDGSPQPITGFPQTLGPVADGVDVSQTDLGSNIYTVIATDGFGCQNLETFFLPFIDAHEVDFTFSNSQICPYTVGDGSITLRATPPPSSPGADQGEFTFRFYAGGVADAANLIPDPAAATDPFISGPEICNNGIDDDGDGDVDGADSECNIPFTPYSSEYTWPASLEVCGNGIDDDFDGLTDAADPDCSRFLSARNLAPGLYTVEIQENISNPSGGCKVYEVIEIGRDAMEPAISLVDMNPNTACDLANADGQFTFNVDRDPSDVVVTTYDIDVTSLPGPASVTNPAYPTGPGQSAGDFDALELAPNIYTVNVTAATGCTATKDFTILDAPAISQPIATITDAEYCDPVLEASARAELTLEVSGAPDNIEDYTLEWYTNAALTEVIQATAAGSNGGDGGEVLTNNGSPLSAVTIGSYYVVATKTLAGSTGGIGCESAPYKVDIGDQTVNPVATLRPFGDTSCDGINFEGRIEITVTTGNLGLPTPYTNPGASSAYLYDWDPANPIALGSLAGNNGNADDTDGDNDVARDLQPGIYNVRIVNEATGCVVNTSSSIQKISPPIFTMTSTHLDQDICLPSGEIVVTDVMLDGVSDGTANFSFNWFRDDPNSLPLEDGGSPVTASSLDNSNFPTIGAGTYYVVARRRPDTDPGSGCESAPLRVDIEDVSEDPTIALTPFSNTACDENFEGSISILVSDPGSAPTPTYTYDWDAGNPMALGTVLGSNGDGDGTEPDGDNPQGLADGVYRLTVTNDISGCAVNAQTTILKTELPIIIAQATPTPQVICNPDGSILVDNISVGGAVEFDHNFFDFTWHRTSTTSAPVLTATTGGDELHNGNFAAIGAGTYFVTALRSSGAPGSGCESAPLRVEIEDQSEDPTVVLTPFANTSCDLVGNFEGSIQVEVTDPGSAPSPTYTYDWDEASNPFDIEAGGGPVVNNDGDGDGTDGDGDNPLDIVDGTYDVIVTNDVSGCVATAQTTVLKTQVPVIIPQATPTHQVICNPDGSILVNSVEVGGAPEPEHDFFDFTWYRNDVNSAAIVPPTIGADELNLGNYATIGAGTYYVTATRTTGSPGYACESIPVRIDIEDNSEDPTVVLTPFANTSCDLAGNFEGSIRVEVTDPGSAPSPTYTYDWDEASNPFDIEAGGGPVLNNDGDGDGTDGDGDNPLDIVDGTYDVIITNDVSGCVATAQTTVLKTQVPVIIPQATPTHQVICNPDGSILVNSVEVGGAPEPEHDFFDFTWYRNDVNSAAVVPPTMGADELNLGNYPTIGAGTYYVTATRTTGSPGYACESIPVRIDIEDNSEDPTVVLTPFANTSCDLAGNFEGSIQVQVTDPGSAPSPTYTYDWDEASNPFDIEAGGGPVLGNNGDGVGPDGDNPIDLQDGVYRLRVINDASGCAVNAQTTILRTEIPIIIAQATAVPQMLCNPDGSITVDNITVGGMSEPDHSDFDFTWYRNDLTSEIIPPTPNVDALDISNYPTIGAGTYFVKAKRTTNDPGYACESAPLRIDIDDDRLNPLVNIATAANTACDNNFDAQISIDASVSAGPGLASNYDFIWVTSPAASSVTDAIDVPSPYSTLAGDNVGPGAYTVRAINRVTQCATNASVTIMHNPHPVEILTVNKTDQMICFPDGSIAVSAVSHAVVPEYSFNWFRNDAASPALEDGASTTIVAPTLDNTNYPAMGADTYFIVGQKNTTLGSGCLTPPFRVNIDDLHVDPDMAFTFSPNSSCDLASPNGQLTATATERDGSTDDYTFNWTLNDAALPLVTTQSDAPPVSQLIDAYEGKYALVVTNTLTGCTYTSGVNVNLDHNISLPNIITVDTFDPLDCLSSGSAEVTAISIGGGPPITGPSLGTDFEFSWYGEDYPGNQLTPTTPLLGNINPGTYYVIVKDLRTQCESEPPTETVILDDDIIYPEVTISQTALQVRCVPREGTAQLVARGDGNTDADPDYQFSWFNNLEATGPSFRNTSTISDLPHGEYSVSVTNDATGCSASEIYVVRDDSDRYLPILSLNTEARNDCLVPNGALLAREVGYDRNDLGYPYPSDNYSTEVYPGADADVSQPGSAMPLVPGFTRNWYVTNLDVGWFTVKITDNNTGCSIKGFDAVADERTPPVITIIEDNPLINCDPARPNGQLSATADAGFVGGYQFDWYSGATASGTVIGDNNKLIGLGMGDYTVRVMNDITNCFADATASITDGRLLPPTPTPRLVLDRTRCDYPDGWVTASVNGITFNYTFDWYNGSAVGSSPDFTGVNYQDRDIGFYTVTAMDQTTGCISLPESVEVKDLRLIPEVIVHTTPSYCEELPDQPGGTGTAEIQLVPANAVTDEVTWSLQPDRATVGIGSYITGVFPGFYQANVVTSMGCEAVGEGEVKTEVLAYNLVSMNGDGKNDNFRVDCISQFPNNNVKIFNRSGVMVYEADGYDNNDVVFDGIGEKGVYTIGRELPVGTYFYIIDKRDGTKPKTGYLELVK